MFLHIYLFSSYYYFLFNSMIESNIEKKKKIICVISENNGHQNQGHVDGGHLMSTCKEACRRAFNSRHPRLVTPMYSCSVLVNSDVLGK